MAARVDELVDCLESRHPASVRTWFRARPELAERNREITRGSILAEIEWLGRGAALPDEIPGIDAELARAGAYLGSPLQNLLWGYRNGHRVQWEAFLDLLDEHDPQLDAQMRRALTDRASAFFFEYADRLSDLVTQTYTQERDVLLRGAEQRRMQAVTRLLDGEPVDAELLDDDPAAHHVGLVLGGEQSASAAASLASHLKRRILVVEVGEGLSWAWLGAPAPTGATALRKAIAGWGPPPATVVAVGGEAEGVAGFGTTHREAAAAHVVRRGAGVVSYEDVVLQVLASGDPEAAGRFVGSELAGIDGADHRSTTLRQTLAAWFAHGQNAAATAAALGVHEQTVAQRLRAVEERIGRPPALRRPELEVALRLASGQTL